jgi:hypothetical protein
VLTEQDKLALRQFYELCDEIQDCRFIRGVNEQDHTITIDRDPTKIRLPYYDKDDFRSFATLFRKLLAKGEPTQIFRIMKILKQFAPSDQKQSFVRIKALLKHEAEHPPFLISIGTDDNEEPYTPRRICDILFNGSIFHSDPALQDDLAKVLDYQPFAMAAFLRYACIVVNTATAYTGNIRHYKLIATETSASDNARG